MKLAKWSVTFGIISLFTLVIFIMALRTLFYDWFAQNALIIAIITGVATVIFVATGTLSIRALWAKMRTAW